VRHLVIAGGRGLEAAMRRLCHLFLLASLPGVAVGALAGQGADADWPQFRGPARDGSVAAVTEPANWPERLTERWRVEVGDGYATPLLVGDRLYVFTRQDDSEVLQALDAATGRSLWQSRYAAPVTINPAAKAHGPGPKSTPTFADGRLHTLGMGGIVTAFDAASGRQLWQQPAGPVQPLYGTAMSPLVDQGVAIVHVGGHDQGALTAFDAETGDVRWRWPGDGPSYASPVAAGIGGVRQVITFTQDRLVGVAPTTGQLLWQRPYSTQFTQNIITPLVLDEVVIVSGYQRPVSAIRVTAQNDQWTTEEIWENTDASLYMANGVVVDDLLFGLSQRNSGQYVLIDVRTGQTRWTGAPRQATNAAIVRAGSLVFALQDDGTLVFGRVASAAFQELRRYRVSDAETWAEPVISGNRLFVKDTATLALWTW
jgi:outer membrane protein assembly factor BamB